MLSGKWGEVYEAGGLFDCHDYETGNISGEKWIVTEKRGLSDLPGCHTAFVRRCAARRAGEASTYRLTGEFVALPPARAAKTP